MRITKIHLQNFKRFSSLLIQNIPENAKLVLLIGANGSGKSSVFDAFSLATGAIRRDFSMNKEYWDYFKKDKTKELSIHVNFDNQADFSFLLKNEKTFSSELALSDHSFYGRTSFRQVPRLTRTVLGQVQGGDIEKDADRPRFWIDRDKRFENDLERIMKTILEDFFRNKQSNEEILNKFIKPINAALANIFGSEKGTKLELFEIIPPLDNNITQINFRKGNSEIHYNYLSAGEKEIINLLFNLISRTSLYQDTIYFLDEIDLHLNTRLQFSLLKEITENWIPENCQLWTASHSLGFIEYAKTSEYASIIDFDNLDFDQPHTLVPEPKNNPEIYEIAVGKEFLYSLFENMSIWFVENKDKNYYAFLDLPKTVFVSELNRNNVYHKVRNTQFYGIVDRDFLTDDDRKQIHHFYPKLYVLEYYSIENYLYHPDNLAEYYQIQGKSFDKTEYIQALTLAKNEAKESFIPNLTLKRTEYPYFGEPEYDGKALQERFKNKGENEKQAISIAKSLNNQDFETYYPFLPMKKYCTQIPQRQNIDPSSLAKTQWFKQKMTDLLHSK